MLRPTRVLTASLAFAALAGLAACGDDTDASSPDTTEAAADTGGEATADCTTPGETVTVAIPEFTFDPDPVEVTACDEVVWSNTHSQAHTSTGNGDQAWSTGNIQPDGSSDPVPFDTPGSYPYTCALHPFMKGTVEVS
jgi:plastocyanin